MKKAILFFALIGAVVLPGLGCSDPKPTATNPKDNQTLMPPNMGPGGDLKEKSKELGSGAAK